MLNLRQELEDHRNVQVRSVHLDLADRNAADSLMNMIRETSCRLVVYNAAYSRVRRFSENTGGDLNRYVEVNVRTPLLLMHGFINHYRNTPDMRKGIILMGSLAGSWGSRYLAPYGASKAFTQLLAESLSSEWKEEGFDVLSAITGATSTPGFLSSIPPEGKPPGKVMEPGRVAAEILDALGRRPFVIPGFSNKAVYFLLSRILPRRISLRIMDRAVSRLYRSHMPKKSY